MNKINLKNKCKSIRSYNKGIKMSREQVFMGTPNYKIMSVLDEIKAGKECDIKWMKFWATIDLLIACIIPLLSICLILKFWGYKDAAKIFSFAWPFYVMLIFLLKFFLNHFRRMMMEIRCAQRELWNFEEKTIAIYCSLLKKTKSDVPIILETFLKTARIENDVGENQVLNQKDEMNSENNLLLNMLKLFKNSANAHL